MTYQLSCPGKSCCSVNNTGNRSAHTPLFVSLSYLPLPCIPALYAVKVRAEAMQRASELVPSGMLSVIGRRQAKYKYACLQAKEHCRSLGIEEPVCSVANYLFPDGRVIAGHRQVWSNTSYISVTTIL